MVFNLSFQGVKKILSKGKKKITFRKLVGADFFLPPTKRRCCDVLLVCCEKACPSFPHFFDKQATSSPLGAKRCLVGLKIFFSF